MFEREVVENPEFSCAVLRESLPLVYSSLMEHQKEDAFCKDLCGKVQQAQAGADNFKVQKGLLCYFPRKAKRCRWVVPAALKSMLLKYFHDSVLSGHLGAHKTFRKIAAKFWWSCMQREVFAYVRQCEACQRAKPAQDAHVGLHSASPSSCPMEKLFTDFVGPLTCTKRGNIAILVVVDAFSKFVQFYPVRKMSSRVVSREGIFSQLLGRQGALSLITPGSFVAQLLRICVFGGGSATLLPLRTTPKVRWPSE
jgi:hypothetical protein